MSTLIARLTRVRKIHESDTDARDTGFVIDSASKSCKRPIVETPIRPLSVVPMFADVRQVYFRNIVFERVFRVGRERVRRHNVVDRCQCISTTLE